MAEAEQVAHSGRVAEPQHLTKERIMNGYGMWVIVLLFIILLLIILFGTGVLD